MSDSSPYLRFNIATRDNSSNLWVRLSQASALRLVEEAKKASEGEGQADHDAGSWSIDSATAVPGVEFLPVEISFEEDLIDGAVRRSLPVYASFNGGAWEGEDSIEIPTSLLPRDYSNISFCSVRALPRIPKATQVSLDPLSVEDWEWMEIYANDLEAGLLLDQVSVVCESQVIELCCPVGGRSGSLGTTTAARLRVTKVSFAGVDRVGDEYDHLWPSDSESDEECARDDYQTDQTGSNAGLPCVLLVADTEVIISPKPRKKLQNKQCIGPLRVVAGKHDFSTSMREWMEDFDHNDSFPYPDAPVGSVLVNSIDLDATGTGDDEIWAWASVSTRDASEGARRAVLKVMSSPRVAQSEAVVHPLTRLELGMSLFEGRIILEIGSRFELERLAARPATGSDVSWQLEATFIDARVSRDGIAAWRVPRMESSISSCAPERNDCEDSKEFPEFVSAGSFLFMPGSNPSEARSTVYELARQSENDLGRLFQLSQTDWRAMLEATSDSKGLPRRVSLPDTDSFTRTVSVPLYESLDWIHASYVSERETTGASKMSIICGPIGCGKTSVALTLASRMQSHRCAAAMPQLSVKYIDCKRLQETSPRLSDILAHLEDVFRDASFDRPCLIILDDVDRLAPNLGGGDDSGTAADRTTHGIDPIAVSQAKVLADRLVQLIGASEPGLLSIIMTCPTEMSVHPSLLLSCTLPPDIIHVPVLSRQERVAFLKRSLVISLFQDRPAGSIELDAKVGLSMDDYRPRDITKAASQICRLVGSGSKLDDAVESVLFGDDFVPLSRMSVANSQPSISSTLSWSDIGGLYQAKSELARTILQPSKYRRIYAQASVRLPRGVLLFGPPGCGKSALVPALARECRYPLITCRGPEVLDRYIGASEAKIRQLFERAASVAPAILFLDELDALAPRRGSDHTGVTDRVVNQLLTYLDGVEDASASTVYVIAATSRPDKIDPALLRPGRLATHVYVGLPESDEECLDLFVKVSSGWNASSAAQAVLSGASPEILASNPHIRQLSTSDIRSIFDTAYLAAVHDKLFERNDSEEQGIDADTTVASVSIQPAQLRQAMLDARPSLSDGDSAQMHESYRPFLPMGLRDQIRPYAIPKKVPLRTSLR